VVTRALRLASKDTPDRPEKNAPAVSEGVAIVPPFGSSVASSYGLDHGVIVNVNELIDTTCYDSAFGCCGYSASDGPNLLCANKHLVGTCVDDCCDPHFAHLSLQFCELFPLPTKSPS